MHKRQTITSSLGSSVSYGTFTLPVARRISGVIESVDIEPAMIKRTRQRAEAEGLRNVVCEPRDVMSNGFGGVPESRDACLLFNILHWEGPVHLMSAAAWCVRPGGSVLVIHWIFHPGTPRGPSIGIRPKPEEILDLAGQTGLLQRAGPITFYCGDRPRD